MIMSVSPSLSDRRLLESSDTTRFALILTDESADISRSSVTGEHDTVKGLSNLHLRRRNSATSNILRPSSVSFVPVGVEDMSLKPNVFSSPSKYLCTTGTEMPSLLAAAVLLPVLFTSSRISICLAVMFRPLTDRWMLAFISIMMALPYWVKPFIVSSRVILLCDVCHKGTNGSS